MPYTAHAQLDQAWSDFAREAGDHRVASWGGWPGLVMFVAGVPVFFFEGHPPAGGIVSWQHPRPRTFWRMWGRAVRTRPNTDADVGARGWLGREEGPVPDLCRNWRQLRTTGDNRPGRKSNNDNARVVWSSPLAPRSFELRILSRKGSGFDSRRSHLRSSNYLEQSVLTTQAPLEAYP
jgi:hypothetical protein